MDVNPQRSYARQYQRLRETEVSYKEALWLGIGSRNKRQSLGVLDIGCGEGSFLAWLEERESLVEGLGVDTSREMIDIARERGLNGEFICHDARSVSLPLESFDAIVLSNVLHLTGITTGFASKLASLLRPKGRIIIGTLGAEDLDKYWEYNFFPGALEIDLKRQPSLDEVYQRFAEVGLSHIDTSRVLLEKRVFNITYIRRVEQCHMSSLWLISDDEFKKGVARLYRELPRMQGSIQEVFTYVVVFQNT